MGHWTQESRSKKDNESGKSQQQQRKERKRGHAIRRGRKGYVKSGKERMSEAAGGKGPSEPTHANQKQKRKTSHETEAEQKNLDNKKRKTGHNELKMTNWIRRQNLRQTRWSQDGSIKIATPITVERKAVKCITGADRRRPQSIGRPQLSVTGLSFCLTRRRLVNDGH